MLIGDSEQAASPLDDPTAIPTSDPVDLLETLHRIYVRRAGPTPGFRRRAWREFQRALDPLAPPKPLPPGRS